MTILLKNGNLDVRIENGVITEVGIGLQSVSDKIIDCSGLTVIPGICDMHVHFRDPGQTHKEDIFSGSEAAAAGGVTAAMCMPNTNPVIDTPKAVRAFTERSEEAKIKIYPCAAITKGLNGKELTDFKALKTAGAIAVSDDGMPVSDVRRMSEAMALAEQTGLRIISHCEAFDINTRLSENVITARELCLAENLGVPVHIAHVSTKESAAYVKIAKNRGVKITCEAAPHHFTLTETELQKRDADYKMNPPLREQDDVSAVVAALRDGVIDCIASDHAPHSMSEKSDFDSAPNGVLGLETILAVTLTRLYHTEQLSLDRIIELLCVNPRRILEIPGGSLRAGSPADIAVVDLNEEWVVEPDELCSKSRNTCFKGMKLKGKVKLTLVDGEVVYDGT
ncbi:MAG: dihydroorotase [Oscillospiraceae bacterium]|nr:dihydroorotase [Oscillospiraceae bacterium]